MKREDMNKAMHTKIIESAIQEFNEKSYEKASMNHICQIGQISKGIIYHYFKDNDELYVLKRLSHIIKIIYLWI